MSDLDAGEVRIPAADGPVPAYRAKPSGSGPFPLVLVVEEIFGVNEHIKDVCRRLAKLGYSAIAPELFARQGDVSRLSDIEEIRAVVAQAPDAQVMADLDAAVDWAASSDAADPARLGLTGFCWGGRIAWLYAAHNPSLKAAVAWYGRLIGDVNDLHPRHPLDLAAEIKVPVLGLYGGADAGIPVESVERMRAALTEAKATFDIHIYPDAPHAFFADYRANYRKAPAEDGWRRLLAWFREHGAA